MDKVLFSSKSNEWATPQDLYNKLNNRYNFTLDPCSSLENHKCDKFYTIKENGLIQDWSNEVVFCNPPYGREIYDWVKKCYNEHLNGTKIVLLIPSRTDTKYFHEFLYKKPNIKLEFIKGRLKFGDSNNSAPFPSLLAYFNIEDVYND